MANYIEAFVFVGSLIVRIGVAGILAHSAIHALLDRPSHRAVIHEYRLVPERLESFISWVLPMTMLVAAVGLLVPGTAAVSAVLTTLLLVLFAGAIVVNIARGRDEIDCGCGGAPGQRLSAGLVVRNLILAMLLLGTSRSPSQGPMDFAVAVITLGGASVFLGMYFTANALLANQAAFRGVAGGQ